MESNCRHWFALNSILIRAATYEIHERTQSVHSIPVLQFLQTAFAVADPAVKMYWPAVQMVKLLHEGEFGAVEYVSGWIRL
jgi:hypothetical protein